MVLHLHEWPSPPPASAKKPKKRYSQSAAASGWLTGDSGQPRRSSSLTASSPLLPGSSSVRVCVCVCEGRICQFSFFLFAPALILLSKPWLASLTAAEHRSFSTPTKNTHSPPQWDDAGEHAHTLFCSAHSPFSSPARSRISESGPGRHFFRELLKLIAFTSPGTNSNPQTARTAGDSADGSVREEFVPARCRARVERRHQRDASQRPAFVRPVCLRTSHFIASRCARPGAPLAGGGEDRAGLAEDSVTQCTNRGALAKRALGGLAGCPEAPRRSGRQAGREERRPSGRLRATCRGLQQLEVRVCAPLKTAGRPQAGRRRKREEEGGREGGGGGGGGIGVIVQRAPLLMRKRRADAGLEAVSPAAPWTRAARAIGRRLRAAGQPMGGRRPRARPPLGPRVPRPDWLKVTVGKKVWEVSHEPFACSRRYKYEPHAESPTETDCPPQPPVAAARAALTDF
ncbi:unnamed protein product [Menidia menidia]|uniref:(Atlantic silverside) hypothetical protein n=1 Tax=Menidia menidia TaxID=238744 RepID=A0A8S4AHF7_9TELE|nr:unnamed protein product [Menidia menidia]